MVRFGDFSPLMVIEISSTCGSFVMLSGDAWILKGTESCTKNATPPPLFVERSERIRAKFLMFGSFDFAVSFVSWMAAMRILLDCM